MPPDACPHCGADLPRHAKACPGCGSDETTGWSDSARANHLGIPDENFDYDQYVQAEFAPERVKPHGLHWLWWITALILVALFLFYFFH